MSRYGLTEDFRQELLARGGDRESHERWAAQVKAAGYCRRPVRLRGRVLEVDIETGLVTERYSTRHEPDRTLLKACGNRRAAVCGPCSAVYKGDAWQLVVAGLRGGKGVPVSVAEHPMLFVTFTAPSFGVVHSESTDNRGARCHPRRGVERCPHGMQIACWERHEAGDPRVGEPLCPSCFDYEGAVIWNLLAPELWRRTTIYIRRALAHICAITQKELASAVRLSYVKVAEYQRRGSAHFHAVIRLDAAGPREAVSSPPQRFTIELLSQAVHDGVLSVSVPSPLDEGKQLRWGEQLDIRAIDEGATSAEAAAAYLAKYVTKSAEDLELTGDALSDHHRRYAEARERLAQLPALAKSRQISRCGPFGFAGHWSTKSRRYSTTMTALRDARAQFASARRQSDGDVPENETATELKSDWSFLGLGYKTAAELLLATSAGERAREERKIARDEIRRTSERSQA